MAGTSTPYPAGAAMRPMRTASHGSLTGAQQYRKVNDGPEPGRLRPARAAPGQARAALGQARAALGQARAAPRAGPGRRPAGSSRDGAHRGARGGPYSGAQALSGPARSGSAGPAARAHNLRS